MRKTKKISLVFLIVVGIGAGAVVMFVAFENRPYRLILRNTMRGDQISSQTSYRPFWSIHASIDKAAAAIDALLNPKYVPFRSGVESRTFQEHLDAVKLELPNWKGEGLYELEAQTLEGVMYPAFRVYHWYSDSAPTLVFHHGAFEYPFDGRFARLFGRDVLNAPFKANLIVERTPFHRKSGKELLEGVETLSKFMAAMAVSVKLTEELVRALEARGVSRIEIAGVSLGGVIANRHHVLFNTASFYVPVVAGTAHERLFIPRNSVDSATQQRNEIIRKHLNFTTEWMRVNSDNVFPILGRYDGYCRLEEQGTSYGNCKLEIWNRGHVTTSLSLVALRQALLKHLLAE
jgi:hypothetical protein